MEKIQELSVGQLIRARNAKGDWSEAIIVTISDSKYRIRWSDNNTEEEITPDAINSGRSSSKWIPFSSTSTATTRRRFSTEASPPPVYNTYRSSKQYSPADLSLEESAHISSSETPASPRSGAENQSGTSSNNSEPTSISSISTSESSAKSPRGTDQTGVKKTTSSKRLKPSKVTTTEPDKNSVVTIEANDTIEVDTKSTNADPSPDADAKPKIKRSSSKRNASKKKDEIARGESKVKGTDTVTTPAVDVESPKTDTKSDSKPKKNDSSVPKGESKVKIKLPVENVDNEVKSPKGDKSSSKSPKSGRKGQLDDSGSTKNSVKSPREGDGKVEIKSPRGDKAPKSGRKSEDKPSADIENSTSTDPKDTKQSKANGDKHKSDKSEKRKSEKRKSEKKTKVKSSEVQKTGEVVSPKGETTKPSSDDKNKPTNTLEVKADIKTEVKTDIKAEVRTEATVQVPVEKPAEKPSEKPAENSKPEVKPEEGKPVVPPAGTKPKAAGAKKFLGPKMPVLKPPSQAYIPRPSEEALISPRSAAAKKQQASGDIPESPLTSPRDPTTSANPKSPLTSPRGAPMTANEKSPLTSPRKTPMNTNPKSPPTSPREHRPVKVGAPKLAAPSREGSPLRVPPTGGVKKVPLAQGKVPPTAVTNQNQQQKPEVPAVPLNGVQSGSSSTSGSMEISNVNTIVVTPVDSNSSNNSAQEQLHKAESPSISGAEPKEPITVNSNNTPLSTESSTIQAPKSPRSASGDVFVLEWSFSQSERNVHMAVGKKGTSINWRNEEWGLAKGIAPLTQSKQFIEVVRVKGKSQQIQIGICKEDVKIEQSFKNSVISPNIIPGTWETIKVRRSKAGDILGLLIDMKEKTFTLFVNGSPEQEASFANKHEWGVPDPITNPIFPFFCIHGDLELQISPLLQVEKYKGVNWAHGDKPQLPSSNRKMSQATEFFDELGLSKYRTYLDKEVDLKAITEADLKKLNIPLVPRKRILDALEKEKGGAETKN